MKNLSTRMLAVQIIPANGEPILVFCKECNKLTGSGRVIVVGVIDGELDGFLANIEPSCCTGQMSFGAKLFQTTGLAEQFMTALSRDEYEDVIKQNLTELREILECAGLNFDDFSKVVREYFVRESKAN